MDVLAAQRQDGILSQRLTHLRHAGVREHVCLLERGLHVGRGAQVVTYVHVWAWHQHPVGYKLRKERLNGAVGRGVLLLLALLVLFAALLLALLALLLLALLAQLGCALRLHHVLQVLEQDTHLLVDLQANLLKHDWPQLILDQLLVVFLEEVVRLVAVLPLGDKLVHGRLDARNEDGGDAFFFHHLLLATLSTLFGVLLGGCLALAILSLAARLVFQQRLHARQWRVKDDLGAAVLGLWELWVVSRLHVPLLHKPAIHSVLNGLAHVLAFELADLGLERDNGFVVYAHVFQLHVLAPHQVFGLANAHVLLGVARLWLHANELKLQVTAPLNSPPPNVATHRRLDAARRLIMRQRHAHERALVLDLALALDDAK
mmetsp:Transcript_22917/g.68119  ORF Transcript_22917/g.68119 Transcript_22917/m.68119 type:complete len:374 (+) Transcript_22917:1077-2198(+)